MAVDKEQKYTTQFQAGLGMVSECIEILKLHEIGMRSIELEAKVLSAGVFSGCTARRVHNLVSEMFAPRFYRPDSGTADRIKTMIDMSVSTDVLRQVFLIQTARAQLALHDFITEVYWPLQKRGTDFINLITAKDFLTAAAQNGKLKKPWSAITLSRVAGYLLGACHDFSLVEKGQNGQRAFKHFRLLKPAALYLAYDLRFSGLSDTAIVSHRDWALFGLDQPELVLELLYELSADGHFLIQSGAGLVQFSWKHPSWKEAIHGIAG